MKKLEIINVKNDGEGLLEVNFSGGETHYAMYDPRGFGTGIVKLMLVKPWSEFEGTPEKFVLAVEKMLTDLGRL